MSRVSESARLAGYIELRLAVALFVAVTALGCHEGQQGRGAGPTEICNFKDDNGDGQVDEGFEWVADGWRPILQTKFAAAYLRAIALSDGRVAVTGIDSRGDGTDRGFLLLVSSDGKRVSQPIWTPIGINGGGLTSLAQSPDGEVAAFFESTDYAGCKTGCPLYFTGARAEGDELRLTSGPTALSFPFDGLHALDIAWTGGSFSTLAGATDGTLHYSSINADANATTRDTVVKGMRGDQGDLAVREDVGIAWSGAALDNSVVYAGIESFAGDKPVLDATALPQPAAGLDSGSPRTLAWLDTSLVVNWVQQYKDGVTEPVLASLATTGEILAGPRKPSSPGNQALDLAVLDDNLVLATVPNGSPTLTLHRLRADLTDVTPALPLTIHDGAAALSMASIDSGLLLIRSNSFGLQSATGVSLALVHCE